MIRMHCNRTACRCALHLLTLPEQMRNCKTVAINAYFREYTTILFVF